MAPLKYLRRLVLAVAVFSCTCLVKLAYDMHVVNVSSRNTGEHRTFTIAISRTADTSAVSRPRTSAVSRPRNSAVSRPHTSALPRPHTSGLWRPYTKVPVTATTMGYRHVTTYSKPQDVHKHNGVWQAVDKSVGVYLFSAFYDNRPGIERPVIRTIAVAISSYGGPLRCLLWFPNIARPIVTQANISVVGAWFQLRGHGVFRAVILSCVVRANAGRPAPIPEHVSIMTVGQTAPTTLLRVQVPETPERPIAFGHCMSVAYWHQDPYRIVEWMELHRIFGVAEVTVYNNSLHPAAARVYQHYANKGFVDFRQAPNAVNSPPDDEEVILLNMSPVLNDCMYRNMYRYHRLVVTDIDEMIVPRMHSNYKAMLDAIDAAYKDANGQPTTLAEPTQLVPPASYMFNNVYFFSDFNATDRAPGFLTSQRYLRHIPPSEEGYSVKSIYNPRACVGLQNHYCWVLFDENSPLYLSVPQTVGMNHHYKKCHFDVYLRKPGHCKKLMEESGVDFTMTRFRRELESRVRIVLKELNLNKFS